MGYSIKEVSNELGFSAHTLRYYEKEGIIPYIDRDESGNRVYRDYIFEWLHMVKCLKETGMTIKDLKHFANLSMGGDNTVPERKQILYDHKHKLEEQLQQTLKHLEKINGKINYYENLDVKPTPNRKEAEKV